MIYISIFSIPLPSSESRHSSRKYLYHSSSFAHFRFALQSFLYRRSTSARVIHSPCFLFSSRHICCDFRRAALLMLHATSAFFYAPRHAPRHAVTRRAPRFLRLVRHGSHTGSFAACHAIRFLPAYRTYIFYIPSYTSHFSCLLHFL